ncbi:cytosol nonspecific dipeptidase, partial [Vibrio cholerae]|nr:cytosol nonspecific dipeptidase [Vibrio cholerae]
MSEFQTEISKLSSNPIWPFFATICSIPHPSKHEEALAQYIINWAKEQGLTVRRDET